MNKQRLATKIWESANKMRSKIEANEYKDYILGFIFYKYLSDTEEKYLKSQAFTQEDIQSLTEDDEQVVQNVQKNIGYFIAYKDLFSTWINKGSDFDVSNVRDALSAFNRLIDDNHKKVFEGIFDTLQTGLSKLGDSSGAQTKAISSLIYLIKDIPMDGKQDYDVLGFIYEYLISMFAANAGKKAGEFYTPHEVSYLMSEIVANHLKNNSEIQIYDPTSGSGSLLINIGRAVAKHLNRDDKIKYYAQELKQNTYNLTRMNLVMRGILPSNIVTRNGDTLEDDWPYFEENDPVGTYAPLYVDAVVSNPPYSQHWDPAGKDNDPRYSGFGMAPKSKADYAFLLHDLYHLKPDGIMTIVLPHGVLFRGGEEGEIRKNLIEKNHIDAIIGLPANIFFGTSIPTIIMILRQKRDRTDTLIIDASKGFEKVGKNNKLRASDVKKIVDTIINRTSIPKFSRVVSRDEIRDNEYNLNVPRYVDSSDAEENWDINALMFGGIPNSELEELNDYWAAFPDLKKTLFASKTDNYSEINVEDIKQTVTSATSVNTFVDKFKSNFATLNTMLKSELIDKMQDINVNAEEEIIAKDIFSRLKDMPLIDKYKAYQMLHDEWVKISLDLETIQKEGLEAINQVDPNIVIKKKDGKESEVQEGWVGHIIPFDLVQNTLLQTETNVIKAQENRLSEIESKYEEILDSMTEDEKGEDTVNNNKDGFVWTEVTKLARQIRNDKLEVLPDSYEAKILEVADLRAEETPLKRKLKEGSAALHIKTKETIETLSKSQALDLLFAKWIVPIISALNNMPSQIIKELASKVQSLSEKYDVTYSEIENQIKTTEESLISMIDELDGNADDINGLKELQKLLRGE